MTLFFFHYAEGNVFDVLAGDTPEQLAIYVEMASLPEYADKVLRVRVMRADEV